MFLGVTWAVAAAMVGFMLGRLSMYVQGEPEEVWVEAERAEIDNTGAEGVRMERMEAEGTEAERTEAEGTEAEGTEAEGTEAEGAETQRSKAETAEPSLLKQRRRRSGRQKRGSKAAEEGKAWSVGSPVSGEVTANGSGGHATVVIRPGEDRLYAPVGGKITRLFPMGNAFLFTTEFGAELYIQAGDAGDELLARHYRPRILQNEVVGKGKLLLEFDRRGLEAEGASAEVSVHVRNCYGGDVRMTAARWVDAGEEILQVREPAG